MALVGSGEFLPGMVDVDRWLLAGRAPRVAIIPTASGEEGDASIDRWIDLGVRHYEAMGCEPVPVRVVDRDDADSEALASLIDGVGLVYLSGGNPGYLARTLRGTAVLRAIESAWRAGAALAGCSAGAVALTASAVDVRRAGMPFEDAFGLVPGLSVIPHFDRMSGWDPGFLERARSRTRPNMLLVGIDENTALVGGPQTWTAMGAGTVTAFHPDASRVLRAGETLLLTGP